MKYVIDLTNTGYFIDGQLIIDTEQIGDNTEFTIEKFEKDGRGYGIKKFDFADLYENEEA